MAMENPFQKKIGYHHTIKASSLTAIRDHILVCNMSFASRTLASGIQLLADDGKTDGIRPRWAQIWAVGPDQKDYTVGQWILLEHGRWTRGFVVKLGDATEELTLRRADVDAILMVSDTEPTGIDTLSNAVYAEQMQRTDWANE